jgi:glycosyltransferase involved in cell wall biosynthesis
MRAAFVHQNMPGQFGGLAIALGRQASNRVAFVTQTRNADLPGVQRVSYGPGSAVARKSDPGLKFERQVANGRAVISVFQALEARGFKPDVIVGHPGWGELLFVKDLYPDVPLICYCEFYFDPAAAYFDGDPPSPLSLAGRMRRHAQSAHLLLSLEAADVGWSPTLWQKSLHPKLLQQKIEVVFDGVDTDIVRPDSTATFDLPDQRVLGVGDEVITFAARSLEPSRGFPSFARSIQEMLARRPRAQVVIAGDEKPHYDPPPAGAATWREHLARSVNLDDERVHFVGRLSRERFVRMLQVSSAHLYLTNPTVLSWSMVEAMSAGCLVVASATPPVTEVVTAGETGFLTSFDDPRQIAADVDAALDHPDGAEIRIASRKFVEETMSVRHCLPRQLSLIEKVLNRPA